MIIWKVSKCTGLIEIIIKYWNLYRLISQPHTFSFYNFNSTFRIIRFNFYYWTCLSKYIFFNKYIAYIWIEVKKCRNLTILVEAVGYNFSMSWQYSIYRKDYCWFNVIAVVCAINRVRFVRMKLKIYIELVCFNIENSLRNLHLITIECHKFILFRKKIV